MTLEQAYKDFDLQYVEVESRTRYGTLTYTSKDHDYDGNERGIVSLYCDYPNAEGRVGFDAKMGGFTFVGRDY